MKLTFMTPIAVRIGAIPWMPKLLPQITATDKFVQKVSKGRVTILDLAGLPNLMLTVKGRKSGVPRTTPLLCVPHEGGNLIAGSNFGQLKPPVWVVNIRAAIEKGELVGIAQDSSTHQARPREITGAEREQLWDVMVQTWPNYARYAARTDRTIPVFYLDPVT